jgi:3-deoxy-D-manno-octulosonic-acid transferase
VWCHAASVGEALTLLDLIAALTGRGAQVLLTTGTVTSAALMAARLPKGAFHQYLPLDHGPWVRRFLDHWRPDLVLWTESELWPNLLSEIGVRGLPAFLVNARLSDRALRGWQRRPRAARAVVSAFTAVLAQSPEDARRFAVLGATDVHMTGNLKLSTAALPDAPDAVAALKALIGSRPCWLAASIHPGEDAVVAAVHRALKVDFPDLLTIVAPRHPPKAAPMGVLFAALGLTVARRSVGETPTAATDVYLADTLGELGILYRACDLVMMGKSFTVGGGQNPAEPAKLGCAVICGPDMSNFRELTAAMTANGAMVQVADAGQLTAEIGRLLRDPAARHTLGQNGAQFIAAESQALAATLAILEPHLINRGDQPNAVDCP